MKINKIENIVAKEDLFFCYSMNLNKVLQLDKHIIPCNCGINKTNSKMFFVFIRNESLSLALAEWTERKKSEDFFIIYHKED